MSQLAEACGVSKANIYHYYSGKDVLLFDILDTDLKALRDRIYNVDVIGLLPKETLYAVVLETLIAYQAADHQHRIQIRRFGVIPRDQQKVLPVYQRDLIKQLSDIVLAILPDIFINDAAKLRAKA